MNFHPAEATPQKDVNQNSPYAADTGEAALSSSYLDLMKESASSAWSGSKQAWSDILNGKGTLGDYGVATMEVGGVAFVGGVLALAAAPEVLAAGGVAAIGTADALSLGGLGVEIGGAVGIVGGAAAKVYEDLRENL